MAYRRRRRRNRSNQVLKILIGILVPVLMVVLIVAACMGNGDAPHTEDPLPSGSTPPETTAPTDSTPPETTLPLPSGWSEINGVKYYYDRGTPVTGLYTIDSKTYGFGPDGALLAGGWQQIGGKTYYINADGTLFYGWLELEDGLYYLKEDGTLARGQLEIDGETWFFTSAGRQIYVVNPWHYVPEGYEPNLMEVTGRNAKDGTKVDASCYEALLQMVKDCEAAGHDIYVTSSYRTHSYQEYLFNRQVKKQMEVFGYSREEAEKVAATISAIPGTSEHQLGLAVDILDTTIWDLVEEQEDLPGQQWLMEHCWEYGFILRYPKDKTGETGIIYEPWHYRYVGTELAAELYQLDMTLEAYLASLQ